MNQQQNKNGEWVEAVPVKCPSWLAVQWENFSIWFRTTFRGYHE